MRNRMVDSDISGGETADLANEKQDVSARVVGPVVVDDIGDSSEGVVADLANDKEDVEGHVCPHCGLGLSMLVLADLATDEEVPSRAHELTQPSGRIDPTVILGMVGLLAMTTFNCLKK